MNFSDNDQQLYWFRKDSMDNLKKLLVDKEGKIDVVIHHDTGKKWGTLYFSDGSGWVMKNGTSVIQIDANGNILLSHPNPNRAIYIGPNSISLGKRGKSSHTAAYGDKVIDMMNNIKMQFDLLKKAMESNPYTAGAASSINTDTWKDEIERIESTNVTLE